MAYVPFIAGGIAAVAVLTIEIRRAFHKGSAVRQVLGL